METTGRRDFFKILGSTPMMAAAPISQVPGRVLGYPRRLTGRNLAMVAFPLGGIGAGSISLGGRGQLRDWEIYNRPDKGLQPAFAFAAIRVERTGGKAVSRVLESRFLPPYEGPTGLGSNNSPGLPRLRSATFLGEYPNARIQFSDQALPVRINLEAHTPFIPGDLDASGLPVAILSYKVTNPAAVPVRASICWSLDNPVGIGTPKRKNEPNSGSAWRGLVMTNPGLDSKDPLWGSFALGCPGVSSEEISVWRGWPKGRWWNSPMLFWDAFTSSAKLPNEPDDPGTVGAVSLTREIPAGSTVEFPFLLAWHFPNRTPERCGWSAPKGDEKTIIGNWYATQFADAAAVLDETVPRLGDLTKRTQSFVQAIRDSNLPAAVKDGAMSNLSTLVTQTCFRTADGEFHAFEGSNDKSGCCYGNCTHVWNYETATNYLFPSIARSMRRASFGYSLDDAGAIHFRQKLPEGKERSGYAAADGQMGQILKAYLDYRLSGDRDWLLGLWPRIRKAMAFCWIQGGWDADKDGVMEGVQHNTYDVEFYGPNPQCGIYYLAGLRACEEMAGVAGDTAFAENCRKLFTSGSRWIDANLFNGEFYIQKVRGFEKARIAPNLTSNMGSENTVNPEYQVGEGCLIDQLVGQYLADICGLGSLTNPSNMQTALRSIYRYNYKQDMSAHESVQRTFALNDEAALVICDYGKAARPRIPFPYYAEVMTGFEYAAATHMISAGMVKEGLECITNIRARYDGERRNPWDEAECGHHYARAMASWSAVLALTGFDYDAGTQMVKFRPRWRPNSLSSFWSCGTGWGTLHSGTRRLEIRVKEGQLALREIQTDWGNHRVDKTLRQGESLQV